MHPCGIATNKGAVEKRTNDMMTYEEFKKKTEAEQMTELLKVADEAKKDDTPYTAIVDEEINVLGNPNKTEVKKHDYTVEFAIPNTEENKALLEANGIEIKYESENYLRIQREYHDVFVPARRASDILEAFTRLQAFINKVTKLDDKGNLEISVRTDEELLEVMSELNNDIEDAIYRAVGTFFGLSEKDADSILLPSAIFNVINIALNNPEVMNGSEVFFGLSQGNTQ